MTAGAAPVEGDTALAGSADPIVTPSGQTVMLQDVVWNAPGPDGLTLRFRFVAPAIATDTGTVTLDTALDDMAWLCATYALPRVPTTGPKPAQIVVSLSDRPVAFGQPAPDATQYISGYAIEDGTCVEQVF